MAEANLDNNNSPDLTTKFYTHFLYKAIFVSIFLLILPLFPWQAGPPAPDHTTSSGWELLQLVFVGIAVSYGLFSKRNDETRKEEGSSDNTESHTYVARLLQVSSVFDDDDDDGLRGAESRSNSKVVQKTWNSQYYRGQSSTVVVPKMTSVLDDNDNITTTTTTTEKQSPLLLPVRSLKNKATESSMTQQLNKTYSLRQISSCKLSGTEKEEENTVLRSPIPWRSRSGRLMEVKEDNRSPNTSFRSSSSSNIPVSSQSPRTSSEVQSQQDVGRRNKSSFKQVPAPPPPPPPPVNRNYTHNRRINMYAAGNGMEFKRNVPSENKVREGAELTVKTENDNSLKILKTPKETQEYLSHDKEIESFILTRGASHGKRDTEFFTDDDDDDDDVDQNTQTSIENPSENKEEFFMETVAAKDSDESEDEDDDDDELQELASKKNSSGDLIMDNGGPDVDKKADEFIAKFREQIRLQRIASIRRSTATALTPKNVNNRPSKR